MWCIEIQMIDNIATIWESNSDTAQILFDNYKDYGLVCHMQYVKLR